MKKVLFALPFLSLAVFLTYCAKESVKPTTDETTTETAATDRGGPCSVTITASGAVRVCGLSNNGVTCTDCNGASLSGSDTGTTFNYTVNPSFPSTPFSVTNTTGAKVQIRVSTGGGACGIWNLNPGQCLQFGLPTTCQLLCSTAGDPC